VRADFVVILGMLHENRRNRLSEWAFDRPFFCWKEWFREWLRLLQRACYVKGGCARCAGARTHKIHDQGWIELLLRSVGIEPASLDEKAKRVALLRMVPFVERNYNLVEHVRGAKAHSFRVHRNEVKAPRGGAECPGTGSKQKGRTESFGLEADFRSFGVSACRRRPEKLVGQVRQKQSGGGGRVGENANGGDVRPGAREIRLSLRLTTPVTAYRRG
jgi:Putative ATP-dependent Lon protease